MFDDISGNISLIAAVLVILLIIVGGAKYLKSWITYAVIAFVFAGYLLAVNGTNLGPLTSIPMKWANAGVEYATKFIDKFPTSFMNKIPEGAVRDKSELVPGTWAFVIPKTSRTAMAAVKNKTNVALVLSRDFTLNSWILGITSFKPNPPFSYPLATIVIVKNGLKHKLSCGLQFDGQLRHCDKNGQLSAMQITENDVRKLAEGSTVTITIAGNAPISWTFPLTGSALAIKNIMNWK